VLDPPEDPLELPPELEPELEELEELEELDELGTQKPLTQSRSETQEDMQGQPSMGIKHDPPLEPELEL
jgi:hypothetical protein